VDLVGPMGVAMNEPAIRKPRFGEVWINCEVARSAYAVAKHDPETHEKIVRKLAPGSLARILGAEKTGHPPRKFAIVQLQNINRFCEACRICLPSILVSEDDVSNNKDNIEQTVVADGWNNQLTITSPKHGAKVGPFDSVTGWISEEVLLTGSKQIWVVIHPDYDFYWVQSVAETTDESWRSATRFGNPDTRSGHHFQVAAFCEPTLAIRAADRLKEFPKAKYVSNIISVYYT
jgi:hypothetical protein